MGLHFPPSGMKLATLVPDACHEALLLITEMTRVDPSKRIKARDILKHQFFMGFAEQEEFEKLEQKQASKSPKLKNQPEQLNL